MPAPHRRSHAKPTVIGSNIRAITNQRDKMRAMDQRKDAQWEVAAARLSPLEQRAQQVRDDDGRARRLTHYTEAVRQGRAKPPVVVLTPGLRPRFFLGCCVRCDFEMWVHSPKPRQPICRSCRGRRSR